MFFEKYTLILTEQGFFDIRQYLNEDIEHPRIAFINEDGELDFTDDFKVIKKIPSNIITFSDNLFISFITDNDAEFYTDINKTTYLLDLLPTDKNNTKDVYIAYDAFKNYSISSNNIYVDLDGTNNFKLSYINFIKLFILYYCFCSSSTIKKDGILRLYTTSKSDYIRLSHALDDILGNTHYTTYFCNNKTTFYIKSFDLFDLIVTSREKTMHSIFNHKSLKNSSMHVTKAILELCEELNYFDTKFEGYNILFGKNLNLISNSILACLAVNGFKTYFKRQGFGLYKLMFVQQEKHKFVYDSSNAAKLSGNPHNNPYYIVETPKRVPIFILETRNYLTNISIRPTYQLESDFNI